VDSWSQIYTNSAVRVSTLSDLNGLRIAILKGGIQEETFRQIVNGFDLDVTIIEVETYEEGFNLADSGSIDAVVSNHLIGDYLFRKYDLIKTPIVFNPTSLYFATAQGKNLYLLDVIDKHLDSWRKQPDSYYYKTLSHWMENPMVHVVNRFIWIIVIFSAFLVLSVAIIQLLRLQVRAKTRHLIEANELLRKNEESYRSLVENLNDVIFNLDGDGNFTFISPRIKDISKYEEADLIGKPFYNYIHPDDLPHLLESLEKTVKGTIEPFEFRVIDKDGSLIYARTSSRPIIKDGEIIGITGVLTNITEQKKMEEQLIQVEKLSSLGGILSGVAHELNNPLTAIIGNAQMLMRRNIQSDIKDKLEVIEKESIRSSKIVGGLLAFARKHKSEKMMIQINDVIEEAYKLREYELRVDNVTMKLDLGKDITQTYADPYQLQQVFINFINNAYDAIKEKGGGFLNIRTSKKKREIIIEFEDNGIGIEKDHLRKVFDPFFTTKETGKGTGLGLSVVYGIISEHEGSIDVDSELGKGTKFTVRLPISKEVKKEKERPFENPMKPKGEVNVLVVEDEKSLREFLVEALKGEGYNVLTTDNGKEALSLIDERDFDIIISDMKMPGVSGQSIYNHVKNQNPKLAERIVFITGDILGRETQNFLSTTSVKYIEKPFQFDDLFSLLTEILTDKEDSD
jgi:two-component system NtrC family sensor kinase